MGLMAMVAIIRIISNSSKEQKIDKKALKNDIVTAKEWIKEALISSNYQADFSLESLKDIDRFFDEQNNKNGILSQNIGRILFALGVYVGETIIFSFGGEWDLEDCDSEMSIKIKANDGTVLFPVLRVMARYQYGNANSIYVHGNSLKKQ